MLKGVEAYNIKKYWIVLKFLMRSESILQEEVIGMKRIVMIIITLSVLMMMSVTVSARDEQRNDNDYWRAHHRNSQNWHYDHRYSNDRSWHNTHRRDYNSERDLPFRWHDHYNSIQERYHMGRIHDGEWDNRFPGVHAHRWHGKDGFWHHGHYITDAVFFFNDDDQLVSIGYMLDGVFIHFRDDNECYENRDSFFYSWWRH